MYKDRLKYYQELEEKRGSKLLVYVTGDRPGLETQIHSEVLDYLTDHIDTFSIPKKVSLLLYSRGGDTLAGWAIVNLVRQFCDEFEVIVTSKAHSTATLISLGADKIIMTKQATLGPIDPSVNGPFNPQLPGGPPTARVPVSVEAVAAYFELAKSELTIRDEKELTSIFLKLTDQVHPLALGTVYRARTQIQMLAEKLLAFHRTEESKVRRIVSVLCSESGSHDYTINRREAEELGLPIEKPNEELYELLKSIHVDIRKELKLNEKFDANLELGSATNTTYGLRRALVESITGGSHAFLSEGTLTRQTVSTPTGPVQGIQNQLTYEGWKYEPGLEQKPAQ